VSAAYDGGCAFPGATGGDGMSLRDWFAGQALAGYISANITAAEFSRSLSDEDKALSVGEAIAQRMYRFADAMLAERAK
jgi:hypothetical protein